MVFNQLDSKLLFYTITGKPQNHLSAELMKTSAPTFGALRETSSSLKTHVDACWNQHIGHLIYMRLSPYPFYFEQTFAPGTVLNWLNEDRKPPFVIFLDIDGVLTDQRYAKISDMPQTLQEHHDETVRFNGMAINNLYEITRVASKIHDVWIVVSSNWRLGFELKELKYLFSKHHFSLLILDKTLDYSHQPNLHCTAGHRETDYCRAAEINYWLKRHPQVKFLILDDNDGEDFHLSHNFPKEFVKVDPEKLLTHELMDSILHHHFNAPLPVKCIMHENEPLLSSEMPQETESCCYDCTLF